MADLAPFPGLRFSGGPETAARATAPPYDVLSDADRDELLATGVNVVAIDLPVPPSVTASGSAPPAAYAEAAALLEQWRTTGVLAVDPPSLYVHEMTFPTATGRRTLRGVIGALALPEGPAPGPGDVAGPEAVLAHEHTTPKASTDRLELLRATRANLSPIWVLAPVEGFSTVLQCPGDPDLAFTAPDGIHHALWCVTDPSRHDAIASMLAPQPVVVADGHHRLQTSLTYRDGLRDASGGPPGADRTLAFVTELSPESLVVDPIHRLVGSWPGGDPLGSLAADFELAPASPEGELSPTLADAGAIGVVTAAGRWLARPRGAAEDSPALLDSEIVGTLVERHGASGVVNHHDERVVTTAVQGGEADLGFILRPPTVEQILRVARGGERMPPKSTFFTPKPPTGLVLRSLD